MRKASGLPVGLLLGWMLVAAGPLVLGCSQLGREADAVDQLVGRLQSADFAERQAATAALLTRDPVSLRHLVLPRLALESAVTPLDLATHDGGLFRGRVAGGDERTLLLVTTKPVAQGALISIPLAEIKALRVAGRAP